HQAGDLPSGKRVTSRPKHDRNRRRRLPRRLQAGSTAGHDDVHRETHQLGGEVRQLLVVALRIAVLDLDILAILVAEVVQTAQESVSNPRLDGSVAANRHQETNAWDSGW